MNFKEYHVSFEEFRKKVYEQYAQGHENLVFSWSSDLYFEDHCDEEKFCTYKSLETMGMKGKSSAGVNYQRTVWEKSYIGYEEDDLEELDELFQLAEENLYLILLEAPNEGDIDEKGYPKEKDSSVLFLYEKE